VTLSEREERRLWILQRVESGLLSVAEAAVALGLSERQVKRIRAKTKQEGLAALAHGNRGRRPHHALDSTIATKVRELVQSTYQGANDCFLSELLAEHEGITISPSSVRRILRRAGIASPRKHRPPKPHPRRRRKPQFGMLVQIDGSQHDWLESRGPRLTLLAAIDDATSQLLAAVFRPTEDFVGYCALLEQLLTRHGRPLALYTDRHSLFFSVNHDDYTLDQELAGVPRPLSQFGRILTELQVEHIPARSPQAKGRVERLFGTLQGRLPILLRLAKATTLEEANAVLADFVPQFNRQFAVQPATDADLFRPLPSYLPLHHVLCYKEPRLLQNGHVISYKNQTWRVIPPKPGAYIPEHTPVTLHRHLDGTLSVSHKGVFYTLELLGDRLPKTVPTPKRTRTAKDFQRTPKPDHPWKNSHKNVRIPTEKLDQRDIFSDEFR